MIIVCIEVHNRFLQKLFFTGALYNKRVLLKPILKCA